MKSVLNYAATAIRLPCVCKDGKIKNAFTVIGPLQGMEKTTCGIVSVCQSSWGLQKSSLSHTVSYPYS